MIAHIGIDISKDVFDVILLRTDNSEHAAFENNRSGFKAFRNWLKKRKVKTATICMEATGLYGLDLATYLYQQGFQVGMINPSRIRAYATSQLSRNKTDKTDAQIIAHFCKTQDFDLWKPPDQAWYELRAMMRHLENLQDNRQQERNRLVSGITSPTIIKNIKEHLAFLDEQIATLEQQIQDHIDQNPNLKQQQALLDSIPGIGLLTASKIIAEIPDIQAFHSVRQLVAYTGLNPRHFRSGTSVRRQTPISKIGNARLRKALYFPAIVAWQHNPIIRAFCERLADNGKLKMVIVVAAMRKLLHLVYGILKSGRPFDPDFLSKSPQNA